MSKAIIAIDESKSYRVYLTVTTDMVQRAVDIHETTPVASAGLGRVITAAGLMGIMMKNSDDKLTLNFKGDGPGGQILATAYGDGSVKGYISNPYAQLPLKETGKLDVGGLLGTGSLTVIKDLGLKEPYIGTVELVSGEIADDLTTYFFISEQQNSSVALGVKVERDLSIGAAGGMIIQMLPQAQEGAIDALEKMLAAMGPLTAVIDRAYRNCLSDTQEVTQPDAAKNAQAAGLSGQTQSSVLKNVFNDIFKDMPEQYAPHILEEREIDWKCDCSHDRMARALATIGKKDMEEIIEEDGMAELTCHFCRSKYHFSKDELTEILNEM